MIVLNNYQKSWINKQFEKNSNCTFCIILMFILTESESSLKSRYPDKAKEIEEIF